MDAHRVIASAALVLLMLLPLFTPGAPARPNTTALINPQIDGGGSVASAATGAQLERAIFPYSTSVQRSQGNFASVWPDVASVLHYEPGSERARRAIIGMIYAESSGNLNRRVRDTGLQGYPAPEVIEGIEEIYRGMAGSSDRSGRGFNGLASLLLMRSVMTDDIARRHELERAAIASFRSAMDDREQAWQFTYNWALANFLAGNYAQAYEGMSNVVPRAEGDRQSNERLPRFWLALSALRLGDPGEAILRFREAINTRAPLGGNEAFNALYDELHDLSREGLGDAQWANRDAASAYGTYYESLLLGDASPGLYAKWVRLGLQQAGYDALVNDMATLAGSSNFNRDPRIHHDRGRLLSFLGRHNEAEQEYQRALELGENDAGLLVSYGQALESRGDHNGALVQAEAAIRKLGRDPAAPDLSGVATIASSIRTRNLTDIETSQQFLDANLLRARIYGAQGNGGAVSRLAQNIAQKASSVPPLEASLLHLYAAYAYEAAGLPPQGDGADGANKSYEAAWAALKGLPAGSAGRAAALAGLARTAPGSDENARVQAGLKVLRDNGYDPASPKPSVANDPDAPDILHQGALLLAQAGQQKEAANAFRVSAVTRNIQDVRGLSGVGRPIWWFNGTNVPARSFLALADTLRAGGGDDTRLAAMRYKQALSLNPALSPAWNNLGVLYAQSGNTDLARFYLSSAGRINPNYALGQQNLATVAYKGGVGNFVTAEQAQGDARKSAGPQALRWDYNLRYDEQSGIPAPAAAAAASTDFLARVPALVILALLLLHTLIGHDRLTNRMGVLPARGLLGRVGAMLDDRLKGVAPAMITPRNDTGALLMVIGIPSVIGMLALAWGAARGSFEALLVYLPVALIAALIAFGANELAQRMYAGRYHGYTLHHLWPLGVLLGLLSIPLGFVYGWQATTRVQHASSSSGDGSGGQAGRGSPGRRARTAEDLDLIREAEIEAVADGGTTSPLAAAAARPGVAMPQMPSREWVGRHPGANILLAGLLANLAIGLLFGAVYWLTGWPSMRLAMFASMLVLAFTAVSEPPADGWSLFRRRPQVWLALFVFAATVVTLIAAGIV
jgi:tetratricopeptide (TPR) repeat protein